MKKRDINNIVLFEWGYRLIFGLVSLSWAIIFLIGFYIPIQKNNYYIIERRKKLKLKVDLDLDLKRERGEMRDGRSVHEKKQILDLYLVKFEKMGYKQYGFV